MTKPQLKRLLKLYSMPKYRWRPDWAEIKAELRKACIQHRIAMPEWLASK